MGAAIGKGRTYGAQRSQIDKNCKKEENIRSDSVS